MSVAVVTGAGRGLGRGIAIALGGAGFDLVLGYTSDRARAEETAGLAGVHAELVGGDVSDAGTAKLLLDAAVSMGGLTAWVNNAGVSVLAPVAQTSVADMTHMLDVNVLGTFHGMQAAAAWFLAEGRRGRIVNIASDLGLQACANLGGYAATKFAVVGLTQAAAVELAPYGVTVNAVCPGTAETDMVLAERASEVVITGRPDDDVRASYLDAIPAGRFCTPADVGSAVAYLCGDGASYVTGQAICINGGSILH